MPDQAIDLGGTQVTTSGPPGGHRTSTTSGPDNRAIVIVPRDRQRIFVVERGGPDARHAAFPAITTVTGRTVHRIQFSSRQIA